MESLVTISIRSSIPTILSTVDYFLKERLFGYDGEVPLDDMVIAWLSSEKTWRALMRDGGQVPGIVARAEKNPALGIPEKRRAIRAHIVAMKLRGE